MIDTVKIYAGISEQLFKKIESKTDITAKFNLGNNQFYYKITNGSLERFLW